MSTQVKYKICRIYNIHFVRHTDNLMNLFDLQVMTFQVVLATDGRRSYILFNYDGRIECVGESDVHPLKGFSNNTQFMRRLNGQEEESTNVGALTDTQSSRPFECGLTIA